MNASQSMDYSDSIGLLQELLLEFPNLDWDREKMKVTLAAKEETNHFEICLPWVCPPARTKESLSEYADRLDLLPPPYYLILLQAGHSALGYYEGGEAVFHKVIKKYMVRRKQGKAQIGHLQSKGKSKAGSRIRLANGISFFEDINAKLEEWAMEDVVERILLSCPVRMQPLLFSSRVKPPFDKLDSRIRKIPMDVNRPGQDELARVNRFALLGKLIGTIPS